MCVWGGGDPEMWKYFIAIEGPGGMWKDFISIQKVWGGGMWKDFVAINGSECVRALTCIAIDDPLGGGRREELSALTLTPNRLYIGSGSKSY